MKTKTNFRVLVLGDQEANRAQTEISLRRSWPFERDMEVSWGTNTLEALEKLSRQRFTLVVLSSRYLHRAAEMLRALRKSGVRLPAVVVSQCDQAEVLARLESLAAAYLPSANVNIMTFYDAIAFSLQRLGFMPAVQRVS